MPVLTLIITDAGRAEIVNATNTGTLPVVINQVALGSGKWSPDATATALLTEIKRVNTIGGIAVNPDTIHVTVTDDSADVYSLGEFGLYTDTGVLFAIYSDAINGITDKVADIALLMANDIVFTSIAPGSITVGGTGFLNPAASETQAGVLALATQLLVDLGVDHTTAVTPKTLASILSMYLLDAGYNAADVLAKLLTVHGALSGLDSDFLDGQHGAFYRNAANLNTGTLPALRFSDTSHGSRGGVNLHALADAVDAGFMSPFDYNKLSGVEVGATADQTAAEILAALLTVDGALSGLDAQFLGGLDNTRFLRSDVDDDLTGNVNTTGALSYTQDGGIRVLQPGGAFFRTLLSTETGYIKITLPVSWTRTMMRFDLDIYDYAGTADGESIKLSLGGYNYDAAAIWLHTFAHILTGRTDKFFNVRFGHDGTNCAIYIGESGSTWNQPQIAIANFVGGFEGATPENWADGWSIEITPTLGTITNTSVAKNVASFSADSALFAGETPAQFIANHHLVSESQPVVSVALLPTILVDAIPSWVKKITLNFVGVSINTNEDLVIKFGVPALETTGYKSLMGSIDNLGAAAVASDAGFIRLAKRVSADNVVNGSIVLVLHDAATNTWLCTGNMMSVGAADLINNNVVGSKSMPGALTRLAVNGEFEIENFNAGTFSVVYE